MIFFYSISKEKNNFFKKNLDKWTALFSCIYVALLKPISALLLTEIL